MRTLNHSEASKYTKLSLEIYKAKNKNFDDWIFIDHSENLLGKSNTGYFGAIYKRKITDINSNQKFEYVIAHRGTEIKDIGDLSADIAIGINIIPKQFEDAYQFTQETTNLITKNESKYSINNIIHTGHSLGGALAKLVGIATSSDNVWSFNAPGVEHLRNELENKIDTINQNPLGTSQFVGKDYKNKITEVNSIGDKVSDFGHPSGTVYEINVTPSFWSNLTGFLLNSNPYTKPFNWIHNAFYEHKIDELHKALCNTINTTENDTFNIGNYKWYMDMPNSVIHKDNIKNITHSTIVTDKLNPLPKELSDLNMLDTINTSIDHLNLNEETHNSLSFSNFEPEFSTINTHYLESPSIINSNPFVLDRDKNSNNLIRFNKSSIVYIYLLAISLILIFLLLIDLISSLF